jgi:hypothetical protein
MNDATTPPVELLACPRTGEPLVATDSGYRSLGGQVSFTRLDGIPALFAEPDATLGEWRDRWHLQLVQLEQHAQRLQQSLASNTVSPLGRERLAHLHQATLAHRQQLAALLAPLGLASRRAGPETHLALRTRLPPDQALTTYYANVHRDWCWGDAENAASLQLLRETLDAAENPQLGRTLVLGAGAGRLAWDVHQQLAPTVTIALDFNPLLILLLACMVRGESVSLHEFPIAPKLLTDQAVLRTLRAPGPTRPGFHPLLGDALRPPLMPGCFDTVITPWVLDILPEDPRVQLARINGLLAPGGQWLQFGSLNFSFADAALGFTLEELPALAEAAGFGPIAPREAELPYMCSPASRHGRREQVIALRARKLGAVKAPARHVALPDWLVTGREPVPLVPAFREQAMATRIHLFIIELIDGKRTLKDMASILEQQRLMSRDEAEESIRGFLIRLFEDAGRGRRY